MARTGLTVGSIVSALGHKPFLSWFPRVLFVVILEIIAVTAVFLKTHFQTERKFKYKAAVLLACSDISLSQQ